MSKTLKHKTIILIGDGMGDLPIAELGGKTPLEAAAIPAMDLLAQGGELALMQSVPEGLPPGSDVANLSLLGYRPEKIYSGRAPLEAASMGVALGERDIAFRCNLVTLEEGANGRIKMVDYSAGHITTEEAGILINDLGSEFNSEKIHFYPGVSYRHLLVIEDGPRDLATEPPHDHTGRDVSRFWAGYQSGFLKNLMEESRRILANHPINDARKNAGLLPANAIWLWGQGQAPAMPSLISQYSINGSLISAVDLLKGIGVYAGLKVINVPGATGYLDTNYAGKVEAALDAIIDDDLVIIHVEAPDEAGHQGLLKEKIRAIEDFDRLVVKPIHDGLLALSQDFQLVVAMDHFTPLATRTHDSRPVPIILFDGQKKFAPSQRSFSEANAITTGIYYSNGAEYFRRLID
ncbi:MAG: cofactor-independent phosphoglycerate mutase [Proteobacteria bacterium]|nr:cofactor-independent phosphoglycerate mutase [Pseudomonadota bacterium]MBU1686453.1 cofactor-independent phosphoglycerate mutase [Pseudomonadota bacterium]